MSATLATRVASDALKDVRHRDARAYPALAEWLAYLELEGKAERTLYEYERKVGAFLRAIPDSDFVDWTPAEISQALLGCFPPASRNYAHVVLGCIFDWLVDRERLLPSRNPMRHVPRPRKPESLYSDYYSEADVGRLCSLEAPHGQWFTILFGTGVRKREARLMRRHHVDLGRARLNITADMAKGGRPRVVPLTAEVQDAVRWLDTLYGAHHPAEELAGAENGARYVWGKRPGGGTRWDHATPLGDTTFDNWYRTQVKDNGIRFLKLHATRHTFATLWRHAGLELEEIQLLLGHKSIRTTADQYVHTRVEDVARRMAAIQAGVV